MTDTIRPTGRSLLEVRQELQKIKILLAEQAALHTALDSDVNDKLNGVIDNAIAGFVLLEDGCYLEQEDEYRVLLEGGNLGEQAEEATSRLLIDDSGNHVLLEDDKYLLLDLGWRDEVQQAYAPPEWWL